MTHPLLKIHIQTSTTNYQSFKFAELATLGIAHSSRPSHDLTSQPNQVHVRYSTSRTIPNSKPFRPCIMTPVSSCIGQQATPFNDTRFSTTRNIIINAIWDLHFEYRRARYGAKGIKDLCIYNEAATLVELEQIPIREQTGQQDTTT